MLKALRMLLGNFGLCMRLSGSSRTDVCTQADWEQPGGDQANPVLKLSVQGMCGKLNICTVRRCS